MNIKAERTQNTIRNILFGFIEKLISILLPFFVRTSIIYKFGMEYVGINSLFHSIIQILNVSELGFSSAILFSMYKPIAEKNQKEIEKQTNLYRSIYKVIGLVVLFLGVLVIPFLKKLVHGECPKETNLYVLYLIYLLNTVSSYEFGSYKSGLLTAYQRGDIISKVRSCVSIFQSIFQILILRLGNNYYIYLITLPIFTIITNLILYHISGKMFPEIVMRSKFSLKGIKSISKQVLGISIGRISLMCRNAFDSIILSSLFGLGLTAIYSNYYYIFSALTGIMAVFLVAMSAGVGNSIATESPRKISEDHLKFDFYFELIVSFCSICLFCLYQPFMLLWVGKDQMLKSSSMALFCIYFYVNNLSQIRSVYSEAAGMWWDIRYLTIIEMFANLSLNFLLGKIFGVNGILLATIITAFLFSFIGITLIVYNKLFKTSAKKYFQINAQYAAITVGGAYIVNYFISEIHVNTLFHFAFKAGACATLTTLYLLIIYEIIPYTRKHLKSAVCAFLR